MNMSQYEKQEMQKLRKKKVQSITYVNSLNELADYGDFQPGISLDEHKYFTAVDEKGIIEVRADYFKELLNTIRKEIILEIKGLFWTRA
jgi:hypothetical protein